MSRIEQLKNQNPNLTIDVVDIINNLFDKVKYTELSVNLIKNKRKNYSRDTDNLINEMVVEYGQDGEVLKTKSYEEVSNIFKVLADYYGHHDFQTMRKFISFNERNLIQENDLSKFKSFEDLELQVSLAELKMIDKDLEKQVIKLYETDEWLVLKPMSFLSSKKYGANTKWCTTHDNNPEYYLRYSRRGILIYCMNRITGEKVAAFKNIDNSYEKETSFWNMVDNRIDSIDSGLPNEVMDIIKGEFKNTTKPNWDLLSDEDRNKELMWIEKEYYTLKKGYDSELPSLGEPDNTVSELEVAPRRARTISLIQNEVRNEYEDYPDQAG